MKANNLNILSNILQYSVKPPLFEPGESRFWDDPYISKSMLEAHLNPEHDAASRRPEIIEKEISTLLSSGVLKPGQHVLDLGCGPGNSTELLATAFPRATIVGIDSSDQMLAVAKRRLGSAEFIKQGIES